MRIIKQKRLKERNAYALVLALAAALILALIGAGLLHICFGVRVRASRIKRETVSMLAAEAGYERAIFWMSQQADVLSGLADPTSGAFGTITFENSYCNYEIQFHDFIGARPVFRVLSTGYSGSASRIVDVYVVQKITGWDMGMCRIPSGSSSTSRVYFKSDEIINIPIHINNLRDSPDERDIYISGDPRFLQKVEMGESRYAGSTDKYGSVMGRFEDGIIFDQPDVRITDEVAVQSKVDRFLSYTNSAFIFNPVGTADIHNPYGAVQLEFFTSSGVGMVRITDNCSVRGYPNGERDYRILPGSGGGSYIKYDIYAHHYRPDSNTPIVYAIEDSYVQQGFDGKLSDPGGQIYVNGNVVIGSEDFDTMVVGGKLTVVATGNIWIADAIVVDGARDGTGMPDKDNPNVLGLIALGVVKVVDPGLANYDSPDLSVPDIGGTITHSYVPVANGSSATNRYLPDPMIVEAAVTVGGGGWGAENVGNRKEQSPPGDALVVRGTFVEAVRGVVGLFNSSTGNPIDGYDKHYYLDERLLEGVLPGNIWFGGKYVPAPAGWHDYRPD
jgi:hypothetical protein